MSTRITRLMVSLACFAICNAIAFGQLSTPKKIEDIRFGSRSEDSMQIVIGGDVKEPGTYFLPKGFGLKSVLGIAAGYEWSHHRTHLSRGQFAGWISIHRKNAKGESVRLRHQISRLQMADTPDVPLEDHDTIEFEAVRLYEEQRKTQAESGPRD